MAETFMQPIPTIIDVTFPEDISNPDGLSVSGQAEQVSLWDDHGVGCLSNIDGTLDWLEEFEHFVFQVREDGTRIAIRKATDEDTKTFRVPIWIQSEEMLMCCGRKMVFVGQLDDDTICTERPVDAKLWWHDAASFYVFTCPVCLECAAVGQQY